MIDISNEVFTIIKKAVKEYDTGITVIGESIGNPSRFPCVTVDETSNVPVEMDTSLLNRYALLQYRIQVFSNRESGKRMEAREIYRIIDETMQKHGFTCKTYSVRPNIYLSNIYQIQTTYEAISSRDGFIFRT